MEKVNSEIKRIDLDQASFKGTGAYVEPTLINFFFGNNATGKTTIARSIKNNTGITWRDGMDESRYAIKVYDQEFINSNIHEMSEISGVLTVNAVNIKKQEQIAKAITARDAASKAKVEADKAVEQKNGEKDMLFTALAGSIWNKTIDTRDKFSKALAGKRGSKNALRDVILTTNPKQHDQAEVERLYASAYIESKHYDYFNEINNPDCLDSIDGKELLGKSVVSSADTPFANFMRALNASAWVKQGHDLYELNPVNKEHKCPYCQRTMDGNIEEQIKASFDEQFREQVQKLKNFQNAYSMAATRLITLISTMPGEVYSALKIDSYKDKVTAIKGVIATNNAEITKKVNDPATIVTIANLAPELTELSTMIHEFNRLIKENNDVLADKKAKQMECSQMVIEMLAYNLREDLIEYKKNENDKNEELETLLNDQKLKKEALDSCEKALKELGSAKTVETDSAMENINRRLIDSGFESFSIRKRDGSDNAYEIIRPDGSIAKNLSEGERNFIAFLYFNEQVRGSGTAYSLLPDEETIDERPKIVVIDDPVSSMDSKSLFMVGAMIRDMIEICHNNAIDDGSVIEDRSILQMFILTHNAYFHREVTYNQVSKNAYVNFYLILKTGLNSRIKLCRKPNPKNNAEYINDNPIKNTYASLWGEYKELTAPDKIDTVSPVAIMNLIRRILEAYFVQLCGYSGKDLNTRILEKGKARFYSMDSTGQLYQQATTMLSYLYASTAGMGNDVYYDYTMDVKVCTSILRTIFQVMDQEQHYKMMMEIED